MTTKSLETSFSPILELRIQKFNENRAYINSTLKRPRLTAVGHEFRKEPSKSIQNHVKTFVAEKNVRN